MGTEEQTSNGGGVATAAETLSITDNRTGETYEVPIEDGTVRAMALRDIKVGEDDFGLMTYDPAYTNTASCRSAVTFIDGDKGILEYIPVDITYEAIRDVVVVVIYGVFLGLQIFLWIWWQNRGKRKAVPALPAASSYGRPLVRKG